MKKIIAVEWLSTDGYFSGPNAETDWLVSGKEAQTYLLKMFTAFDTILLGQATYKMFSAYWPNPDPADKNPQELTDFMNNTHKVVFSTSIKKVEWNNSELIEDINLESIKKMKQGAGKDMVIFGSGSIVSQLTKLKLIDEYYFMVVPVFLGNGKTIFKNEEAKLQLKALDTKTFDCGNVMLHYQAIKN